MDVSLAAFWLCGLIILVPAMWKVASLNSKSTKVIGGFYSTLRESESRSVEQDSPEPTTRSRRRPRPTG